MKTSTSSNVIDKLPDKGEFIKLFRDEVQSEILYREQLLQIEESTNKLSLLDSDIEEKHTKKICDIEKCSQVERYKPFATLKTTKDIKEDSKIFKIMEDCRPQSNPT